MTSSKITIQWFENVADIPETLWSNCLATGLEGRWWYWTLENSDLQSQFKFFYGLISSDGKFIGIVPAFLMDVPMDLVAPPLVVKILQVLDQLSPGLAYQRTFFIGSPCADEGSIGLLPDYELAVVVGAIQKAAQEQASKMKAPMIVWKDFPDSYRPALQTMARERGLFELVSYPGTVVMLDAGDKDSYFAKLKPSHRHNLRKKLRISKEVVDLESSVLNHPDETLLDKIFPLFWQTYEKGKTKFEKLNQKFFSLIAKQELAWFVLLRQRETGKLVAFMLCFKLGHKVINKFIGMDYSVPRNWSLYFRLWEAALDWVLSVSATEFQSGQTGYRAKIDMGNTLVPLTNFCKHKNPLIHWIYKKATADVSWTTLDRDLEIFFKGAGQASAHKE